MKYIVLLTMSMITITSYGMHNSSPLLKAIAEKDERIALLEKELMKSQGAVQQLKSQLDDSVKFTGQLVTQLYAIQHGDNQLLLRSNCN